MPDKQARCLPTRRSIARIWAALQGQGRSGWFKHCLGFAHALRAPAKPHLDLARRYHAQPGRSQASLSGIADVSAFRNRMLFLQRGSVWQFFVGQSSLSKIRNYCRKTIFNSSCLGQKQHLVPKQLGRGNRGAVPVAMTPKIVEQRRPGLG